jgi:type I pantothenate kinase
MFERPSSCSRSRTDGFLYRTEVLERRGIMDRKGFPESFDRRALLRFVAALKSGAQRVEAPVYSHLAYDVVPDQRRLIERPDIVILEGLNVLQGRGTGTYISDFFDFSIYVDADPIDIETWYIDRFLTLRDTAFRDPGAFFHRYADLDDEEARAEAHRINEVNLYEHILHTRERATLILQKGSSHDVERVRLRRR